MATERVQVLIGTPLSEELVAQIRAVDPRLEVAFRPICWGRHGTMAITMRQPGAMRRARRSSGPCWRRRKSSSTSTRRPPRNC